jgi:hypothetical protein
MHTLGEIEQAALKLPEIDRIALAQHLLGSVLADRRSAVQLPVRKPLTREQGAPVLTSVSRLRYTFKVDASYDSKRKIAGIGMVIYGIDPAAKSQKVGTEIERISEAFSQVPARIPEKLAILRALQIAKSRGYSKLDVRSDCSASRRTLTDAIQRGLRSGSDRIATLILECVHSFEEIVFPPHRRQNNHQAHKLARHGLRQLVPQPWPEIDGGLPATQPESAEAEPDCLDFVHSAPLEYQCPDDDETPF